MTGFLLQIVRLTKVSGAFSKNVRERLAEENVNDASSVILQASPQSAANIGEAGHVSQAQIAKFYFLY